MPNRYRFNWFAATLILFLMPSCAGLEHFVSSIGDAFRGNTRKTIADFDLEDKKEYRNYYYLKHKQQREEAKNIIYWMDKTDPTSIEKKKAEAAAKKTEDEHTTNSTPAKKSANKRNIIQKLLKVRPP